MPLHRRRSDGASAVLALLIGLTTAVLVHGSGAPPLYDGIATPPEPYRWVSPPADLASSNQACVGLPGSTAASINDHFVVRLRYPTGLFDDIQFYDGQRWQPLAITRDPGGNPWARASVRAFGDIAATAQPVGLGASILTALRQRPEVDALLALVIVFGVTALVLEIRRRRKPAC